ncbi:MAG TPA: universal stress protein [Candidatus Dormibacteraeota bacterium]|nr:universal stress protein [Candidatus Dormibacteraeota bacterium]
MTTAVTETAITPELNPVATASTGPILLAVDGSPDSDLAARAAIDLARALKQDLHVVHCWIPMNTAYGTAGQPSVEIDFDLLYRQPAKEQLHAQVEGLERLGAEVAAEHLLMGRASEQIPDLATLLGAQMILIGSRGFGAVKRLLLGSTSEAVVHTAPTPVLVVRGGVHAWPPDQILVGSDGSDQARRAALAAASLARASGAPLTIVTVIQPAWLVAGTSGEARTSGAARATAERMTRELADQVAAVYDIAVKTSVLIGDPAASLITAATAVPTPALIAVGWRGLGAIDRLTLGSVSTKVLHSAPGPVLITRLVREAKPLGPVALPTVPVT